MDKAPLGTTDRPLLVSVIIAAYNAEPYIAETCESVLQQSYAALELIVVDDGSTDGTANVVGAIAASDSRVRLIQQRNLGVAAARNCGIAASSGEFIAPLDADDLWDRTKLEQQVRRMHEAGPDTGMVYSWWAWIDMSNTVIDRSPRWMVEGRVFERLVEVNFTGNASVPMFRRSSVREVGGYNAILRDQGCHGCEDWDLAIRIAERHGVAVVPAVLVGYRRRNDSMSTACDTMWRSQKQVMAAMVTRQPSISAEVLRRSNGQFALYLAGVSFWSGRYVDAVRWTLRARPFSLTLSVVPHVIPVIWRRLFHMQPTAMKFGTDEARLNATGHKEPLVPYDRIYDRRWRVQEPAPRPTANPGKAGLTTPSSRL